MSLRLTFPPLHEPEPQPESLLQGNQADRQSMQPVQSMQFKRRTCLPTELTKSWRVRAPEQVLETKEWLLQSAQQTEALVRILHGDSLEKRLGS